MSFKASLITLLAVLVLCTVAVTPANAIQPAPKSYVFLDIDGFLIECIDFTNQGNAFFLFSGVKGVFQTMDISGYTNTPGASLFWGQGQNLNLAGLISRKTTFQGTCESRGISFYNAGATTYQGCAMAAFNRYPFGNFNESWLAIQLPNKCNAFFAAARNQSPIDALKGAIKGRTHK